MGFVALGLISARERREKIGKAINKGKFNGTAEHGTVF